MTCRLNTTDKNVKMSVDPRIGGLGQPYLVRILAATTMRSMREFFNFSLTTQNSLNFLGSEISMEKTTTPSHHLSFYLPQNPLINKRSRFTSVEVAVADTTTTAISISSSPSSSIRFLSTPFSFDDFGKLHTLGSVKQMHTLMIKMDEKLNCDVLEENLIKMYLKYGDFRSASVVLLMGSSSNSLQLNTLVEEFSKAGGGKYELLQAFHELHKKGFFLNDRVLTSALRVCECLKDLWLGVEIHACLIKMGFDSDVDLNCALWKFYANCWGMECADKVYNEMPERSVPLWNEAIMVNAQSGSLVKALDIFREMQFSCGEAQTFVIAKVLQICWKLEALKEGKQIHGHVIRVGLISDWLVCNSLINMYAKSSKLEPARSVFNLIKNPSPTSWNSIITGHALNGSLSEACKLFQEMELSGVKPDLVTWNCLLSGHFHHKSFDGMLKIFRNMQSVGFKPNSSTMTSVLQAVSELGSLGLGKETHGYVIRNGLEQDVYVGTSLIDMYVKSGSLADARAVFDNMKNKNIFAWNSLVSGYAYAGYFKEALGVLNLMEQENVKPDLVTLNGLISGYSMWGRSKEALLLIRQIKVLGLKPNVVSWTALISGCSQRENHKEAIEFFIQMLEEKIKPNSATISSLLKACAGLSLLETGKEIHCLTIRNGSNTNMFVATALIDMYCKSGSLENAHRVFRMIEHKTIGPWNSMLMGFAIHGLGKHVISLFNEMCEAGVQPDSITFTAVLSGCRHSGLIDEGWRYFDSMSEDYKVIPTFEHYSCMVDLLGRNGYLDEAWDLIQTMPFKPDAGAWGALLGSCRIHKNVELAEIAAKHLYRLEPSNSANYLLMMNIYASANMWEEADNLRDIMGVIGAKSRPGWSWIQIDGSVHIFSADGKPHPDMGEICFELYQLISEMKKLGYAPDTDCVFHNVDEAEKERVLLNHTEKLAITYGLMKMENNGPVRVITNTRVCADCHTVVKYMSQICGRKIILRDGARFHHFVNGKCSCNDYW